jgi:hypothetical protein
MSKNGRSSPLCDLLKLIQLQAEAIARPMLLVLALYGRSISHILQDL